MANKYGPKAKKKIEKAMKELRLGRLKSGKSGKEPPDKKH